MKTILFVCTGNVCRSPMAVGFLREKLRKAGLEGEYRVHSAGVWGLEGQPATPYACEVMAKQGIDISDHRSHDLTPEDVDEADLILTMEERQKARLPLGKTYTLKNYAGSNGDVLDPIGEPSEEYDRRCKELKRLIEIVIEKIIKISV